MALEPPDTSTTTEPVLSQGPTRSVTDDGQSLDLEVDGERLPRVYNTDEQTLLSLQIESTLPFQVGTEITVKGFVVSSTDVTLGRDLAVITAPGITTQILVRDFSVVDLVVTTAQPGFPNVVSVSSYFLGTDIGPLTPADGGPSHFVSPVSIPTSASPSGASQTIQHGLGVIPQVTVIDATGLEVQLQVDHPDVNTIVLTSNVAFTGTVICDSGFPQTTIISAAQAELNASTFAILVAGRE